MDAAERSGRIWNAIRDLQDQQRRQRLFSTSSIRANETTKGTFAEIIRQAAGGGGGDVNAGLFQISTVANSTLVCYRVQEDGSLATDLTTVNIPPLLQSGASYQENVQSGSLSFHVTYEMVPTYAPGQRIIALEVNEDWYDLNYDGRHYVETAQVVQVCVNNVTRRMLIRGSAVL